MNEETNRLMRIFEGERLMIPVREDTYSQSKRKFYESSVINNEFLAFQRGYFLGKTMG